MRTHSGLIRFFSKRVMSQSDGTALRRSASETADCRISRIAAGSARVLHAAASKTRRYCEAKSLCGGKPYGAGVSDMALSGVLIGDCRKQLPGADNCPRTAGLFPHKGYCIHRTPDIYGPALKSRKKIWFFVGCKHIFGVSLCWQRPDGVYALSFLYSVSASLRQSGVQVFRKPVRPFFHLFFLATLGKLLCR